MQKLSESLQGIKGEYEGKLKQFEHLLVKSAETIKQVQAEKEKAMQ